MGATMEHKFNAAIRVIQSLPKNGPYEPSYSMKLHFYGLYKQATQGLCVGRKPPFWDVIGRAKWDAWKKIGDISKEEAMTLYVEDLKKIVETMSYTEDVANFISVMGPFFEFISDDAPGEANGTVVSNELYKREGKENSIGRILHDEEPGEVNRSSSENGFYQNGDIDSESSDSEEEEYIDACMPHVMAAKEEKREVLVERKDLCNGPVATSFNVDISQHVVIMVENLNRDMEHVLARLRVLESVVSQNGLMQKTGRVKDNWWPLTELSPKSVIFILAWPMITQLITYMYRSRRRHTVSH